MGVRLVDGRDGAPAAGVEVTLYRNTWREAPERIATVRTDAAGRATLAVPVAAANGATNLLLVARRGDDVAFAQRYGGVPSPARRRTPARCSSPIARSTARSRSSTSKVLAYRRGGAPRRSRARARSRRRRLAESIRTARRWPRSRSRPTGSVPRPASSRFRPAACSGSGRSRPRSTARRSVRVEEYKRPTFEVEIAEPATRAASEPSGRRSWARRATTSACR